MNSYIKHILKCKPLEVVYLQILQSWASKPLNCMAHTSWLTNLPQAMRSNSYQHRKSTASCHIVSSSPIITFIVSSKSHKGAFTELTWNQRKYQLNSWIKYGFGCQRHTQLSLKTNLIWIVYIFCRTELEKPRQTF